MKRQLQIKTSTGLAQSEWNGGGSMPIPPDSTWTFVDVTDRDAQVGMTYDAATDTFAAPPVVMKTRVTKSQVVSVLTPVEWQTAMTSTDATAQWGMAQFQLAESVDLADPKFAELMTGLIAGGIVKPDRAVEIQADLMKLANP
jgi:hypothetical protein